MLERAVSLKEAHTQRRGSGNGYLAGLPSAYRPIFLDAQHASKPGLRKTELLADADEVVRGHGASFRGIPARSGFQFERVDAVQMRGILDHAREQRGGCEHDDRRGCGAVVDQERDKQRLEHDCCGVCRQHGPAADGVNGVDAHGGSPSHRVFKALAPDQAIVRNERIEAVGVGLPEGVSVRTAIAGRCDLGDHLEAGHETDLHDIADFPGLLALLDHRRSPSVRWARKPVVDIQTLGHYDRYGYSHDTQIGEAA